MYLPGHFEETRVDVLHGLIRARPFATLVTVGPDGPVADHIPMLVDPEPAPFGTLRGHIARPNPLWRTHPSDKHALAIFHGPQAYISPNWYPSKHGDSRVAPTWNYAVVQATGPLVVIDDREWLRAFVSRLTDRFEAGQPDPWSVSDAPAEFVERLVGGIVGIEIPIARLEGKWKVSQNRPEADREGTARGLEADGSTEALAMAELVRAAKRG
jgi:transcriptional regulator